MSLRFRISAAAHRDIPHANPLSVAQMASLVQILAASAPQSVLEIGCGPGTFSLELAKSCDTTIKALDINPAFLARARALAGAQTLRGSIEFLEQPASSITNETFNAVVCIGSSHAFGTTPEALRRCSALLKPGGVLLFADLVWLAAPPEEFLKVLDTAQSAYWLASEAETAFTAAGLSLVHTETASQTSWQSYESNVLQGRLKFAETLGADEADEVRNSANAWSATYEQFGKHYLGFTAYIASPHGA